MALQERANIAEVFAGTNGKVAGRLTLNFGIALHVELPSRPKSIATTPYSPEDNRCSISRVPPGNWSACDFGPARGPGLPARGVLGDTFGLRNDLVRNRPASPLIHAAAVPVRADCGPQSQDNINPAFALSNGPTVQVAAPNPSSGLGRCFRRGPERRSGYYPAVEFTVQKTLEAMSTSRSAIWDRRTRTWACRNPTSTRCRPRTLRWGQLSR